MDVVNHALAAGTRLHEFRLIRVLGEGGFGIVYLAHDEVNDRPVAIKDMRAGIRGVPDEALLRHLMQTLLGAIETLHRANVYHRDISPDNILLQDDGAPVLLDFGSARQVIADRTQTLTSILKPSF